MKSAPMACVKTENGTSDGKAFLSNSYLRFKDRSDWVKTLKYIFEGAWKA